MTSGLNKVSAISLFVDDLAAAKEFYRTVFGGDVVHEDDDSVALGFQNLIINLLRTTAAVSLVEPIPVAPREAGVRAQLSIWVEDVDAVCAELQRRGVTLLRGPVDEDWGLRVATFTDPAGHSWEVGQPVR